MGGEDLKRRAEVRLELGVPGVASGADEDNDDEQGAPGARPQLSE